mmetsp:Transcript_1816/g.4050  ORF Transcript_1816/g.4050 Transcript_1816/m.4050 type:complete len:108 (+) Transcript_1816:929-1252(+)
MILLYPSTGGGVRKALSSPGGHALKAPGARCHVSVQGVLQVCSSKQVYSCCSGVHGTYRRFDCLRSEGIITAIVRVIFSECDLNLVRVYFWSSGTTKWTRLCLQVAG